MDFLIKINDLQKTTRYGNNIDFNESTAEHTFKLLQIVDYFYKTLNLNLDYQRCMEIAIYHDFGEMDLEKDIDLTNRTAKTMDDKKNYEEAKIDELAKYYEPIKDYFDDYEEKKTREALFVRACDKLEGMLHPISVGKPIPNHEPYATYADKAVKNFPELMPFYKEIKKVLKEKYNEWGYEWKQEYESIFEDSK